MAGWKHDEDRTGVHADARAGRGDSGHARSAEPAHLAPDVRSIARSESGVTLSGGQAGLPVVQIGHMGPAAYPLGPVIGLVALGQALRRAGAAADVGAAVEAALGGDPPYPLA
jgi:aspartate aminotransferase-like enzyme